MLPPVLILDADDAAQQNLVMAVDDIFNLTGIDIVAGGDDHPLDALTEIHEAVLIHVTQITGVQPDAAVIMPAQGGGGFLGVVHIAHHDGGAGHADLAFGVGIHFLGGAGSHDLVINVGEGDTDGAGTGVILGGQAGGGDTFGGAVALSNLLGAAMLLQEGIHLLFQLLGQTVAAGENALQEAQILPLQILGPQQRFKKGGDTGDDVGLLLDEGFGVGFDAELRNQDAGGTADESGVDADAQTEAVEYGHNGEHFHPRHAAEAGGGDGLQTQSVEIQVGEHNALGGAGGAAGIEDGAALIVFAVIGRQGGILASLDHIIPEGVAVASGGFVRLAAFGQGIQQVQGSGQLIGNPGDEDFGGIFQFIGNGCHLAVELRQSQNGLALGEIQVKSDLLRGGQGVDHIGDGADAVQGVEAVQRLGSVGHADGHLVTLADAHVIQTLGGGIDALHKLGKGGFLALEDVSDIVRILTGGAAEQLIHGLVGILQGSRRGAVIFGPGSGSGNTHNDGSFLFLVGAILSLIHYYTSPGGGFLPFRRKKLLVSKEFLRYNK